MNKGYYKKSQYVHLWVHLLLKANHEPKEFMWNNQIILIKEGQLITGRKELNKETGISETTIERILEMLENEHQIGQQKTTKYRLITILNWKEYQKTDSTSDNKRTTSGHKQECKELKEEPIEAKASEEGISYEPVDEEGVTLVKRKGIKKLIRERTDLFSMDKAISECLASPQKTKQIVGAYFKERGWKFNNWDQFETALAREIKPASLLKGYSGAQIKKTIDYCRKEWGDNWTLETISKWINEVNKHG
jgi:hypothetical protein